MLSLYRTILYKPLFNALIFLYNTVALQDLGLAIIFLTVLIRFLLFPLFQKSLHHQAVMQELQPEIKKIQDKYGTDKQKQAEAMLALYKGKNINPFSGFFLIFLQLPILIALYQIFLNSLKLNFEQNLYSFIKIPETFHTTFLGLINLGEKSILMVGLAAIAQYFQTVQSLPKISGRELTPTEKMSRQMAFLGPGITLFIFYSLPAAVSLYWTVSSLFSIFQQFIQQKSWKTGNK